VIRKFFQKQPLVARQFIKFSMVGFIHFLLDAGLFALLRFGGVFPELAKTLSFVVTASSSYYFNRRFTFRSGDLAILKQYSRYFSVAMVGLFINTGSFSIYLRIFGLPEYLSFIAAAATAMFWNFLVNKFWTFRR